MKQNNFKTKYQLLNPRMYKQNAHAHTVLLKSKSCGSCWTTLGFAMLFSNINLMNVLGFILEEYYIIIHIKY